MTCDIPKSSISSCKLFWTGHVTNHIFGYFLHVTTNLCFFWKTIAVIIKSHIWLLVLPKSPSFFLSIINTLAKFNFSGCILYWLKAQFTKTFHRFQYFQVNYHLINRTSVPTISSYIAHYPSWKSDQVLFQFSSSFIFRF